MELTSAITGKKYLIIKKLNSKGTCRRQQSEIEDMFRSCSEKGTLIMTLPGMPDRIEKDKNGKTEFVESKAYHSKISEVQKNMKNTLLEVGINYRFSKQSKKESDILESKNLNDVTKELPACFTIMEINNHNNDILKIIIKLMNKNKLNNIGAI